jgi:solute carrier family 35 protein E1
VRRSEAKTLEAVLAAAPKGKAVAAPAPLLSKALQDKLQLALLFAVWYAFNAGYNVYNAFVKKDFHYPWTTSTLQLFIGLIYALPLWFFKVRKTPNITKDDLLKLLPIAGLNAFGHTCAVIAMFEHGGGSFTHVIKASEPVVSTILNLVINGVVPKPFTAASLLPITYGVAYASTLGNLNPKVMSKELTTKAAVLAMGSNVGFALRSILRKNLPHDFKHRTNLDPANEHALTTLLSSLIMVPFVLAFEGLKNPLSAYDALKNKGSFLKNLFLCGFSFYMYNELQNKVLGSLGPVPTAVGNTLKRVVIFVALYLFTSGETFPLPKVVGCAIAIAGCLGFAIFDSKKM